MFMVMLTYRKKITPSIAVIIVRHLSLQEMADITSKTVMAPVTPKATNKHEASEGTHTVSESYPKSQSHISTSFERAG